MRAHALMLQMQAPLMLSPFHLWPMHNILRLQSGGQAGSRGVERRLGGSGGDPRLPASRETEARPMALFAREVNTEGPAT